MENASKALLIAGAILIAILLIAIGMMVFNSANSVIDTATSGMTDNQKTMHNKKFEIYEGTKSGSMVKDLIEVVITNNSNNNNQKVKVNDSLTPSSSGYVNAQQYTVTCTRENGVITSITIE